MQSTIQSCNFNQRLWHVKNNFIGKSLLPSKETMPQKPDDACPHVSARNDNNKENIAPEKCDSIYKSAKVICKVNASAKHLTHPQTSLRQLVGFALESQGPSFKRARCPSGSSDDCCIVSSPKRQKRPNFIVKSKEIGAYFRLLETPFIYEFLHADGCKLVTDKYLLAIVFAYFKRASFSIREYTKMNFFICLYLASDMEEDEEEFKYEIFPWALGKNWKDRYMNFLRKREKLWSRIEYRAVVSRRCCEEIMAIQRDHWAWKRDRPEYHGGAVRQYAKDPEDDGYPRGPDATPNICGACRRSLEYDSLSPDNTSWYLSSSTDSSPDINRTQPTKTIRIVTGNSRFDMKGLRQTLQADEGIWACHQEE